MIAQVWTSTGPAGPESDEMHKFVSDVLTEARGFDGCEAIVTLRDPTTGEAMAINLFRDQAAMDAFQKVSDERKAEAEKVGGGKIAAPRVFTEVDARL
jgi:hypothetical protein